LPHADFKQLADCGHLPMFEQEAAFVQAVMQFCESSQ
jgi:pimeloyl-ACP methyl ester carboxylesterase